MKVRVFEYLWINGIRHFTFLVGHQFESFILVKGRKRVNIKKLFLKTKLRERDLNNEYAAPDKEYVFEVNILPDNDSRKKRI